MNVFELFATLGLDSSSYDEGIGQAEDKGRSFGSSLGTVVAGGAKIGMAAIAATTTAVVGAGAAFASGITSTAAYGDEIQKNAAKMGLSIEKYQEWQAVMQHSGTSMEALKTSMKTLATAVETGNDAFEKIGLTQEQLANMDQEQIFAATIEGLQNVESTSERTYLASQLLGRGATELGALLSTSAEDTEAMKQRVHELGGVMSDEAVNAAAGFQDSLQDLQTSFSGLKNNMMSQFLPSISTVMDGLAEIMIGNDTEGLGMIDEGVNTFIDNLLEVAPRLLEVGGRIIGSILTGISQNLPKLLKEGTGVLNELIQGIIVALPSLMESAMIIIGAIGNALLDNAELLLNTGLQLLFQLMDGLTENLPVIIPAIASVIAMIITTLTAPENLGAFIQGALQLIMALADGIVKAIPELIKIIPEVIVNLVQALIENFPAVLETTLYLIGALGVAVFETIASLMGEDLDEVMAGIGDIFNGLVKWGADVAKWVANGALNIKNKVSQFFTNIGQFFSNGFNNMRDKVTSGLNAIRDKFTGIFDKVRDTVKNAIDFIKGLFKFDWELPSIKLPHFSVSGKLDLLAVPPQIPKVGIDWYKKAMNEPYILNEATIFGASNGKLLGAGESGSEVVVGTEKLMSMMRQATGAARPITVNVYGAEGQDIRELAKAVTEEIQNLLNDKEKAYA